MGKNGGHIKKLQQQLDLSVLDKRNSIKTGSLYISKYVRKDFMSVEFRVIVKLTSIYGRLPGSLTSVLLKNLFADF